MRRRVRVHARSTLKEIRAHGHGGTEANEKRTCISTCVWTANLCEATMGTMCDARMSAGTMCAEACDAQ
eukprot:9741866-Alexandrium_andersonii.AAC.1